jgi:hypothetical protein
MVPRYEVDGVHDGPPPGPNDDVGDLVDAADGHGDEVILGRPGGEEC